MLVKIYRVTGRGGKYITPLVEDGEKVAVHADMLRYDLAFCNPDDHSQVIFPIFKGKNGKTSSTITQARWSSFGLVVKEPNDVFIELSDIGKWLGFHHASNYFALAPITLGKYLSTHPGEKIAGWR